MLLLTFIDFFCVYILYRSFILSIDVIVNILYRFYSVFYRFYSDYIAVIEHL